MRERKPMGAGISGGGAVTAIIPAGGKGLRFGTGQPKQFTHLAGWPVLAHTVSRFDQTSAVDKIIVAAPPGLEDDVRLNVVKPFGFTKDLTVVRGGKTRQESVYNGFLALEDDVDLVVVHDGVRPLVKAAVIEAVIDAAREYGAAIAAVKVRDTLKRVEDHHIQGTLDREMIWQAQTPQAFKRGLLAEALAAARRDGFTGTDESSLLERLGLPVRVVAGNSENIKITMPEDLALAEALIGYDDGRGNMRIGMGFDVHTLTSGRKLMLGGIEVPFDRGLAGHSDADVLIHAFCDALLGAAGLGDIGRHFPDKDPEWAGAAGTLLLGLTAEKIRAAGLELVSADLTLMAQRPKIMPYARQMIETMAGAMSVDAGCLNVKATTTEGLGAVGREEGLAAMAVVLLKKRSH